MSKISCDVIKDLLPSYIDNICSEGSRELVDEHLKECKECRQALKMLQETEITTQHEQRKEIDYMKKVKRHYTNKSIVGLVIMILSILLGMGFMIFGYGYIPLKLTYVILPVLIFLSYYTLSDYHRKPEKRLISIGLSIFSVALTIYTVVLMESCLKWVKTGQFPFGIDMNQTGPFVHIQLLIIITIQSIMFLSSIIFCLKNQYGYHVLLSVTLTDGCFIVTYMSILKTLTDIETFPTIRNGSIQAIFWEGVIATALIYVMQRYKTKQK